VTDTISTSPRREEKTMKAYRCWYKDGSARTLDATGHREAAGTAQELAHLENCPVPTDPVEKQRYMDACKVVRTECLTDATEKKWK